MGEPAKPRRPVLRYHGGKWRLAPWIISHFPEHRIYVEPFGGAASVLLRKPRSRLEVWNDLEGEVVNLFQVLRQHPDELAEQLALTPYARDEYHDLYASSTCRVDRARRFVARSFMGQSSKGALRKSGFDTRINPDGYMSRVRCLRALPAEFSVIAERMQGTVIESRPALDVFERYDRMDVLFYVDPPYLARRTNHYTHEMTEEDHVALIEALRSLKGMVVLSGYPGQLYDSALTGWRRVERPAHSDGGHRRTEVLWFSPNIDDASIGGVVA